MNEPLLHNEPPYPLHDTGAHHRLDEHSRRLDTHDVKLSEQDKRIAMGESELAAIGVKFEGVVQDVKEVKEHTKTIAESLTGVPVRIATLAALGIGAITGIAAFVISVARIFG